MICLKHKTDDFTSYCPKFYAELKRRFETHYPHANAWTRYLPNVPLWRVHQDGCLHSDKPDFIIQRKGGLADSIYFRHCGGEFRDLTMRKLELGTEQDTATASTGKWSGQALWIGASMVPGLEWEDTHTVQDIMICDGMVRLH